MEQRTVQAYILQRLQELEKGRDLDEMNLRGKISFGVSSKDYEHLPAWKDLVKKKKQLVKMVWINAIFVSLWIVSFVGDIWDKFSQNWLKALFFWLGMSAVIMFFQVLASYFSLFYHFRQTEREIRKLIYQDILYRLKKEGPGQTV
jgi:magnesium-transporting ATPase (P-type)